MRLLHMECEKCLELAGTARAAQVCSGPSVLSEHAHEKSQTPLGSVTDDRHCTTSELACS